MNLKISKWPDEALGLDHIETSWWAYRDEACTDLVDDDIKSAIHLNICPLNLIVPEGETYYAKALRHFRVIATGELTDSDTLIGPSPISSVVEAFSVDVRPEVEIESPYIFINVEELHSDSETFKIKLSKMRNSNEGHLSSSYVIYGNSKIIFKCINTEVDKHEITVDKTDINLLNYTEITIEATQTSNTGGISESGFITVPTSETKFRLVSEIKSVPYDKDLLLRFDSIGGLTETVRLIEIVSSDGSDVVLTFTSFLNDTVRVPMEYLKDNDTLLLKVYPKTNRITEATDYKAYVIEIAHDINAIVKDYKFTNELVRYGNNSNLDTFGGFTTELKNRHFIMFVKEHREPYLFKLKSNSNTLVGLGKMNVGIDVSEVESNYKAIRINDDTIAVLCNSYYLRTIPYLDEFGVQKITADGQPATKKIKTPTLHLSINSITIDQNRYELTSGVRYVDADIIEESELPQLTFDPVTKNLIFKVTVDEIDYLRFYNIVTKETKDIVFDIGFSNNSILEILPSSRILCFGSDGLIYTYNLNRQIWDIVRETPTELIDNNNHSLVRRDGNVYIFNTSDLKTHLFVFKTYDNSVHFISTTDTQEQLNVCVKMNNSDVMLTNAYPDNKKFILN